jgi:hypothetical protein
VAAPAAGRGAAALGAGRNTGAVRCRALLRLLCSSALPLRVLAHALELALECLLDLSHLSLLPESRTAAVGAALSST